MGGDVETDTKRGGHCPPDIYTLPTGSLHVGGQIVGQANSRLPSVRNQNRVSRTRSGRYPVGPS